MKVLIIGLDGATWDVLDDYLLENHMPNLMRLKQDGYSGVLQSTEPPTTSTAWTTFFTGCHPSTHGITGYQEYSFQKNSLKIRNSTNCRVPNLWEELSQQGYKVVGINLPLTYPCPEVNGILVAGFGCPGPESQFTFPADFKDELLSNIPDYDIVARCDWSTKDNFAKFDKNVEQVERSFRQRLETARLCSKKINWDIMMVQFQDTDVINHNIWAYVGKDLRDKHSRQRDRLFKMFEKLDKIIGELLDLSTANRLLVLVASDHGGGRLIGEIRPNVLLHKWGYLKFKSPVSRMVNSQRRRWHRKLHSILYGQKEKGPFAMRQPDELNINWKRSKAVVLHTATNSYLYIYYKERQSFGSVESSSEFNGIVKDLKERFSNVEDPVTKRPLFARIATPQQLYGVSNTSPECLGDLILVPQEGYDIRTSLSREKGHLYLNPAGSIMGTHRYEGIYIFFGTKIKASNGKQAHIVDIAPTIYAALGAKLPPYLDGRVLNKAFDENLNVEYLKYNGQPRFKTAEQRELPPEEQAAISKRLAELGYL